jgi:hypothetical protein
MVSNVVPIAMMKAEMEKQPNITIKIDQSDFKAELTEGSLKGSISIINTKNVLKGDMTNNNISRAVDMHAKAATG